MVDQHINESLNEVEYFYTLQKSQLNHQEWKERKIKPLDKHYVDHTRKISNQQNESRRSDLHQGYKSTKSPQSRTP